MGSICLLSDGGLPSVSCVTHYSFVRSFVRSSNLRNSAWFHACHCTARTAPQGLMRAARSWAACVLLTLACHADELGWQARDGALTAQVHLAQLRPHPCRLCVPCTCHSACHAPTGAPGAAASRRVPRGRPGGRAPHARDWREHSEHSRPRAPAAAARRLPHHVRASPRQVRSPAC